MTPNGGHLAEIVGPLGLLTVASDKRRRVSAQLDDLFTVEECARVVAHMSLSHGEVAALVSMGPSAYHIDPAELAGRIEALPEPVAVTLSADVAVRAPRP